MMGKTSENAISALVSGQYNRNGTPASKEWHGRVDTKPPNARMGSDHTRLNRRKMQVDHTCGRVRFRVH